MVFGIWIFFCIKLYCITPSVILFSRRRHKRLCYVERLYLISSVYGSANGKRYFVWRTLNCGFILSRLPWVNKQCDFVKIIQKNKWVSISQKDKQNLQCLTTEANGNILIAIKTNTIIKIFGDQQKAFTWDTFIVCISAEVFNAN